MTDLLEHDLIRTLRQHGDAVVEVPVGMRDAIEGRARRRRRARRAVLSGGLALAVLAVAVGGWQVARPARTDHGLAPATVVSVKPSPARIARPVAPSGKPTVRPLDQTWPAAVERMPATAPGGAKVLPVGVLDASQLLVAEKGQGEQTSALLRYDLRKQTFASVADLRPIGSLRKYFAQSFATDDRTVAWNAEGQDAHGKQVTEFVAADLAGGHERLLATVPGALGVTPLELVDHRWLVYSGATGVRRISLSGNGKPELVPGGRGLRLTSWPWASTLTDPSGSRHPVVLTNLETGARRTFSAAGMWTRDCVPDWCVGSQRNRTTLLGPTPGSRTVVAPRSLAATGRFGRNRFVDATYGDRNVLWDIKTGTLASYGGRPTLVIDHQTCLICWPDPSDPDRLLVFDGAAVR
ncbi:hypothetical protein Athai_40600 [Actinocatenispora thailandica]|uniref:WD40 repeat domain-containing protein n=1 Tax=Actinocatenispora thailandica TaxID=227318 RepID=A0A7R7DS61_9ACTN|nr:hypothetical protein [Actinocatenispora thailandica]BCJ36557.1 hypothetical protein Athai_40600 [Actinocatenispora thailandica]